MFIESLEYALENNDCEYLDDNIINYCNNWLQSGFTGLNNIMSIIIILIEYKKYDTIKNMILYSNGRIDLFIFNIYKLLIEKKLYEIAFIIHKHKHKTYIYGNKEIDYYYVKYMIKNDKLSEYATKRYIFI
jgi:hypothetical protein